jgi:hypothetical protein
MAELRKMDTDLVGPSRLQAAAQKRVPPQFLLNINVRDGLLTDARELGTAAAFVSAVTNQETGNPLWPWMSGHDREITPHNSVSMELVAEPLLGDSRASEYEEAARLLI